MSWKVSDKQIEDFAAQESQLFFNALQNIDELVIKTIPIYTIKNPNPKSGRPDCRITTREKENFRMIMRAKLQQARTAQERQKIVDHYKQLFSAESK